MGKIKLSLLFYREGIKHNTLYFAVICQSINVLAVGRDCNRKSAKEILCFADRQKITTVITRIIVIV